MKLKNISHLYQICILVTPLWFCFSKFNKCKIWNSNMKIKLLDVIYIIGIKPSRACQIHLNKELELKKKNWFPLEWSANITILYVQRKWFRLYLASINIILVLYLSLTIYKVGVWKMKTFEHFSKINGSKYFYISMSSSYFVILSKSKPMWVLQVGFNPPPILLNWTIK